MIFQKKLDTIPLFVHINCESIPNSKWFFFFFLLKLLLIPEYLKCYGLYWIMRFSNTLSKIIFQKNYYNTGQPSISWRNASCSLGK